MNRPRWMRSIRLTWGDLILLSASSFFWPTWIIAANLSAIVHPERLIALGSLVWLFSIAAVWVLVVRGMSSRVAVHSVFMVVVLLMAGGAIMRTFVELVGAALLAILLIAVLWVFKELGDRTLASSVVVGLAVALASGPVVVAVESLMARGESVVRDVQLDAVELESHPDIFVIVFDGYPGQLATVQDPELGDNSVVAELDQLGFQSPRSAWSPYWRTHLSVAALLEMGYPATSGWRGTETERQLQRIMAGDNELVDILDYNGYETYLVESGWSGGHCGASVDNCIVAPLMDEAMYLTLRNTVLAPWVARTSGPYTAGVENTMDWLIEEAPRLSHSGEPSFVFAHLIAPHPPFHLNAGCRRTVSEERQDITFYFRGVSAEDRERFFLEQKACVDNFMVRLADSIEKSDLVVFVSDHGTDRRYQLARPEHEWAESEVIERLNVFLSIRAPGSCQVSETLVLPNLMRQLISCLIDRPLADLAPRMWVKPMVELEEARVDRLLEHRG